MTVSDSSANHGKPMPTNSARAAAFFCIFSGPTVAPQSHHIANLITVHYP